MTNPLLSKEELPNFDEISHLHFKPAIEELTENYMKLLKKLVKSTDPHWENTIQPLDEEYSKLDFAWNIISHLNAVDNREEVRKAYEEVLPIMVNFGTEISQNKDLFKLYTKLFKLGSFDFYSIAQKRSITEAIKDFKLSGINLPKEDQDNLKGIKQKLSDLSNNFEKNIIDSTQDFKYHVTDEKLLDNLPGHTKALAKAKAEEEKKDGWVLTLDAPCYIAVMSYAKDRKIREDFYKAHITRASEESNDGKFDNRENIDEILKLRQKKAGILGFDSHAALSLQCKMAKDNKQVTSFLEDLLKRSRDQAKSEKDLIAEFAKVEDALEPLEPWDQGYYSTLYMKKNFDFSEEDLRPYFPEDRVFEGMFKLAERIFKIKITEVENVAVWHPTVKLFEVKDEKGKLRGKFYADLYARDFKRSGAWMADLRSRMIYANGDMMYPIAFLNGNFTPPTKNKPALLSHNEINTLFHEFGHTLQHVLTQIDYPSVAGISGVPWDAVELPSQFMENYCWEWEVLEDLSSHHETGKKLPKTEFDKLLKVKNYNSAMGMVRQLEFALFDFRIHMKEPGDKDRSVQEILNDVREKIGLAKPKDYNRFQNAFSHIFAGGYSAGYYSYKWAEVLSSDAFSRFEEDGVFNEKTGLLFRETVLEQGGSRDAMDIFVDFRGRQPNNDALLRHNGIK